MNRFRTRKKAREGSVGNGDPETPTTPSFFKKARKGLPESKPEVDLATALPSSDDFRTSLLMPNLSARFSMLREQDDPSSKIGKANDDSVLFPKRASRLNLFSHNPLADIAEVSSIHGSIRPPFAFEGRTNSFASVDGYGTDDDSQAGGMMGRAKPGEGNNLFGGRQKVYKIPMGESSFRNESTPDLEAADLSSNLGGKAVYEGDVTLSTFQQLKQQEREQRRRREQEGFDHLDEVDREETTPASSPVTGFSRNRGTSSSTTSGPSNKRTSTAATSVESQPPVQYPNNASTPILAHAAPVSQPSSNLDRNGTKTRRMYGHGLDQTMQSSSTMTRLESLNRQRAMGSERPGSVLSSSKSMGNLNERYQKTTPVYTSAAFRTASPPPSATPPGFGPMDSDLKRMGSQSAGANQGFGYVPPLSPPISEGEDGSTFVNAVQPEDRGKATAMGLFNKPSKQYDEQQFSQRQLQMHEGRNTPIERKPVPQPTAALPEPPEVARPRNQSNASYRSRDSSLANRHEYRMSDSRKAALQIAEARMGKPSQPKDLPGAEGTFLETLSGSDPNSDAETETPSRKAPSPDLRRPPSEVHPALRSSSPSSAQNPRFSKGQTSSHGRVSEDSPTPNRQSIQHVETDVFDFAPSQIEEQAADSPTLGPGLGLSGLVRAHMRTDSDKSSILPSPSPRARSISRFTEDIPKAASPHKNARSFNQPESTHSNPWEFDDIYNANDGPKPAHPQPSHLNAPNVMSLKARQILGQATALKAHHEEISKTQRVLGEEAPRRSEESSQGKSWQDEMRARHQRGGSTETQKEREEFSNELAERRKMVQEKLKSFAETDSRPNSPLPAQRMPDNSTRTPHPFAMLRAKSSKSTLVPKSDPSQSKAMKMLGIGNATMSSTSPKPPQDELWREEEERMLRDFAKTPKPRSPRPRNAFNHPQKPQIPPTPQPYLANDESRDQFNTRGPSPPSSKSSRRERSSSEVSGRSKSRTGRYRDDLEQAMVEGTGSISRTYTSEERNMPKIPMPHRPSMDTIDSRPSDRSASAASGRFRSESRATTTGYFDSKVMLPIQTNNPGMIGLSPRPSPLTPYSANSTPPLHETSPAMSMASTPTLVPPTSYNNAIRSANLASRKKSVNKALISEPTFLSSTYSVSSVADLPVGAREQTQSPPVPAMNPRRRRGTNTQTLFSAFGRSNEKEEAPPSPFPPFGPEVRSTFSDEGDKRPRPRQRLRKSSSEGGNLNARARQQAMMMPSPAVPQFPQNVPVEGGMF